MQKEPSRRYRQRQNVEKPSVLRRVLVLLVLMLLVFAVVTAVRFLLPGSRLEGRISATLLPCMATQDVTPFGENVLYYDGTSIHCLNAGGGIRWSFPVGVGARYSVSDTHVVAWSGSEVFIIDSNGHATYNENMEGAVQFARVGSRYCAVVFGTDTEPTLMVKNMDGTHVDIERDAYPGMLLLDVGFYGEADQYMWTLAMDVYGVSINTVLNTFQVGKMNTGVVNLGSYLAYHVVYENSNLRVFTTQQMYVYDYKAVQDLSASMLVHGWQVVNESIPVRGSADILLARTSQLNSAEGITDLRILNGRTDRRFIVPTRCVGAAVQNGSIYALSGNVIYRTSSSRQQFYSHQIPLPAGVEITALLGLTSNGRAIVACGNEVYSVTLPR
ncbi:MAG: hypothetical protein IKH38_06235 [Clostridia bacterium]|nr:hypothetical protein [Clostridia bacterium]